MQSINTTKRERGGKPTFQGFWMIRMAGNSRLLHLIFLLCFILLSSGCESSDQRVGKTSIIIEDFAVPKAEYVLDTSTNCPPATEVSCSWTPDGYHSRGALRIDYTFGQSHDASTNRMDCWTQYSVRDLKLTGAEDTVSLFAKGRPGSGVMVRLVDSTGQTHHSVYNLGGDGWEKIEWNFARPNTPSGITGYHWGGSNDGKIHMPISEVLIGPHGLANRKGTLLVDRLAFSTADLQEEELVIDGAYLGGHLTHAASGFLLSASATKPSDALLLPLKPRLFRTRFAPWESSGSTGFASVGRFLAVGCDVQLMISDEYLWEKKLQDSPAGWPGDNNSWQGLEATIRELVARANSASHRVQWDIWNEPDHPVFWKRGRDQFFETWKYAYREIRRLDPHATIVGPSIAYFSSEWLEEFLIYCKQNRVLPDILTWHEMSTTLFGYKGIPDRVQYVRKFMQANGIPIDKIAINEIIGKHLMTNPGAHVWFFASLEDAGVVGACHACWEEAPGYNNGLNESLDGILIQPGELPRSTWWVYRKYADMQGRRIGIEAGPSVNGIAAMDDTTDVLRVLLGRDLGLSGKVVLRLDNLRKLMPKSRTVHVSMQRIPDSGLQGLDKPVHISDRNYRLTKSELRLDLPSFGPTDAYYLEITPIDH